MISLRPADTVVADYSTDCADDTPRREITGL